jgi:hypothetical protein
MSIVKDEKLKTSSRGYSSPINPGLHHERGPAVLSKEIKGEAFLSGA